MPPPDWLGRDLLAGALPWSQGAPAALSLLLERYTLDHAAWIGLYVEPDRVATLVLRWDGYWRQTDPDHVGPEPPILAIRFDALERSEVRLRAPALSSVVSGSTNRAADAHRTHVVDRRGGEAALVHSPGVRLLCLSRRRELLPLLLPAEAI